MKVSAILIAAAIVVGCSSKEAIENSISIIPKPAHVQTIDGHFTLTKGTVIYLDGDTEILRTASFLNDRLSKVSGYTLEIKQVDLSQNEGIFFIEAGLPKESYSLKIDSRKVVIEYGDGAGAFYGLQTLLQLFPSEIFSSERTKVRCWGIPCCDIEDEPRFDYRGMHLDCCLHFFDIDFLKRYIDLMALHKVNRFHWHLTEDQGWRLEINKYPLLTEKGQWRKETVVGSLNSGIFDGKSYGGYYTQAQVRDLVEYAAARYVTIIPEIEMPGHALAAIACYPLLSCGLDSVYEVATKWGVFQQVYCPKEETFSFLEDVLDEVMQLFPSQLIHIGGDECPKSSWKKCANCQALIKQLGLKDEYGLQSWFIQRIEKYINSKGREIIGWDEILQGGLAPNATVMSWLGEEGGIKAAIMHHEAVMAPHQKYYLDYWQGDPDSEPLAMGGPTMLRTVYDYNPVPETLSGEEREYILGVEGCVWTEYLPTPERVEYMAWPRMCAIAESGWSTSVKDWDSFARRLEHHFGRLDKFGVRACRNFFCPFIEFHPDTMYNKVVTISSDLPDAEIRYTLDGSEPNADSFLYETPFTINSSQTVKAILVRDGKVMGEVKTKSYK